MHWSAWKIHHERYKTRVHYILLTHNMHNTFDIILFTTCQPGAEITRHLCCKNSKTLHPLDILACNSATKPCFQNPTKSLFGQCSIDVKMHPSQGYKADEGPVPQWQGKFLGLRRCAHNRHHSNRKESWHHSFWIPLTINLTHIAVSLLFQKNVCQWSRHCNLIKGTHFHLLYDKWYFKSIWVEPFFQKFHWGTILARLLFSVCLPC